MLTLIETYSIQEIILFLVTFAIAIKGTVTFWDWGYDRLRKVFKKEIDHQNGIDLIQKQIDEHQQQYNILKENQEALQQTLSDLMNKVDSLVESDKDDIKSFITERHHHFCYQEKWIDDYSLDCIERRYKHYKNEGGNSFIKDLMEELRALPKQPPQE